METNEVSGHFWSKSLKQTLIFQIVLWIFKNLLNVILKQQPHVPSMERKTAVQHTTDLQITTEAISFKISFLIFVQFDLVFFCLRISHDDTTF